MNSAGDPWGGIEREADGEQDVGRLSGDAGNVSPDDTNPPPTDMTTPSIDVPATTEQPTDPLFPAGPADYSDLPDVPQVVRYYDQEGEMLARHPRYDGSMAQFAAEVEKLKPHQCAWPDGSRLNQSGKPCRAPKLPGANSCVSHTGTRTQRKKKAESVYDPAKFRLETFVPPEVARLVADARADPELLSVRQDVALLDARRAILAARLYTGESGGLWAELNLYWDRLAESNQKSRQARDEAQRCRMLDDEQAADRWEKKAERYRDEAQQAVAAIGKTIQQGHKDESAWKELIRTTRDLVDMKEKEHNRLQKLSQVIYAEDVMNMCSILLSAVLDKVSDPTDRIDIADTFSRVLNPRNQLLAAPSPVNYEAELAAERKQKQQ